MFARFTDPARRAFVRAGTIALDAGAPAVRTGHLLLALAELRPFAGPLEAFAIAPEAVREHVDTGRSRELLATLGIDADKVRARARRGADDPALWRLRRSRVNPLRVTLLGPLGALPLEPYLRKTVEVAQWRPGPVTGERLLWGLLADAANGTARILYGGGVDLPALVAEAGIPVHRPSRAA